MIPLSFIYNRTLECQSFSTVFSFVTFIFSIQFVNELVLFIFSIQFVNELVLFLFFVFFNESLLLHLISKSYLLLSFHNPTLQLHPHSLIIDKFCRTSALMTSNLNLPIILGHAVKHGVESGVSFWSGVWSHYWSHF